MIARRTFGLSLLFLLVIGLATVAFTGGTAGQASQCEPIEDRQLCLDEVSVTDETLVIGEQGEFSVTVVNEGNTSTSGAVLLHTASPKNETNTYRVQEFTLDSGESQTVSRAINASTPGTHGIRLSLIEPSTQHVFDITAIETIEILDEHPKELGGPIDRTEIALGALLTAVLGMLLLGYRQFNS